MIMYIDTFTSVKYYNIVKSEAFLKLLSVRLERIAFFVKLGMLELSYRFQTLHGDCCSSYV